MNATAAANAAGYKHPNKLGPRLVKVGEIKDEIDRRLKEMALTPDEVRARLGDMATASMGDFIDDHGLLDLDVVKEKGHLVKKLTYQKGNRISIELYDAQAALMHIDKVRGGKDGDPIPDVVSIREVIVKIPSEPMDDE